MSNRRCQALAAVALAVAAMLPIQAAIGWDGPWGGNMFGLEFGQSGGYPGWGTNDGPWGMNMFGMEFGQGGYGNYYGYPGYGGYGYGYPGYGGYSGYGYPGYGGYGYGYRDYGYYGMDYPGVTAPEAPAKEQSSPAIEQSLPLAEKPSLTEQPSPVTGQSPTDPAQ